jgi:hypothetical protein
MQPSNELIKELGLMCGNAAFFLKSAQKLKIIHAYEMEKGNIKNSRPDAIIPIIYLISHAIEVMLKVFLLHHGFDQKQLKSANIRHNLSELFREAKQLDLNTDFSNIDSLIPLISDTHKNHTLRYYTNESDFGFIITDKIGMVFFIDEPIRLWKKIMHQVGIEHGLDRYLVAESTISEPDEKHAS